MDSHHIIFAVQLKQDYRYLFPRPRHYFMAGYWFFCFALSADCCTQCIGKCSFQCLFLCRADTELLFPYVGSLGFQFGLHES